MIRKIGLKIRMLFVSAILFSIYAVAAIALMEYFNVGLTLIFVLTLGFVVFQYFLSQKLILRSVNAEKLPNQYSWIDSFVNNYCDKKDMEKPDLYLARMNMPNAFAFGRKNNGTVVISKELLNALNREEVKGVVSHELAHVENRDSLIMLLGQSISSIVGIAVIIGARNRGAGFIASLIMAQIAQLLVSIVLMALSRYREYVADEVAAEHMGTGRHLASALDKISNHSAEKKTEKVDSEVGALCIIGPKQILSSHPPVEERIKRLKDI